MLDGLSSDLAQRPAPGMTASVALVTAQRENVLVVPSRALRREGGQQMVEVVTDGKRQAKPVSTGLSGDQSVEVREGLAEGDLVVLPAATTTTSTRTTTTGPGGGFGFIPGVGPVPGGGGFGGAPAGGQRR
ncbi:MAG TPA: hypothetical protein VJM69_04455, partial [Dehalococcoidia bacterium]|nr:hypothetical protein [Dehalococcoidia bacterium]